MIWAKYLLNVDNETNFLEKILHTFKWNISYHIGGKRVWITAFYENCFIGIQFCGDQIYIQNNTQLRIDLY
jgi:hypothetical protein